MKEIQLYNQMNNNKSQNKLNYKNYLSKNKNQNLKLKMY